MSIPNILWKNEKLEYSQFWSSFQYESHTVKRFSTCQLSTNNCTSSFSRRFLALFRSFCLLSQCLEFITIYLWLHKFELQKQFCSVGVPYAERTSWKEQQQEIKVLENCNRKKCQVPCWSWKEFEEINIKQTKRSF